MGQIHANKWLLELKNQIYEERLNALNMPKLEDGRKIGDLVPNKATIESCQQASTHIH